MPLIRRSPGKDPFESELGFFDHRVGRLLHHGAQVGHVASHVQWAGVFRLRPLPTFLITWHDGSHELIAEDPEPFSLTREVRAGRLPWFVRQHSIREALDLTGEDETDFTVEWLDDAGSAALWPTVGFPEDQGELASPRSDEDS